MGWRYTLGNYLGLAGVVSRIRKCRHACEPQLQESERTTRCRQPIKMYGEAPHPAVRGVAGRLNLSELLLKQARVILVREPQIDGNAGFRRYNLEFR
jgi:hypothetical protein